MTTTAGEANASAATGSAAAGSCTVHVVCSLFHPSPQLLDAQLESILAQSHADLRIWLRDDAGSPQTASLIASWQRRDARIVRATRTQGRLGTPASYGALLREALDAGAAWIALCDQDDEWVPSHLADSLAVGERAAARDLPLLVHGDLELIDEHGAPIAPSFFAHQRIRHEAREPLRVLAVQNFVTGCATVIDRRFAELAWPIPPQAIMHDWWLALCAASTGLLLARETTTVRYRQHARNQIGATPYGEVVRELGRRTLRFGRHSAGPVLDTVEQARALRDRLRHPREGTMSPQMAEIATRSAAFIDRYLALFGPHVSRMRRAFGLAQLGIGRQDRLLDWSLKAKLMTTRLELDAEIARER